LEKIFHPGAGAIPIKMISMDFHFDPFAWTNSKILMPDPKTMACFLLYLMEENE
jgi:hypothetical protein